ncbi:MAG TPA: TlpA disulfide reductase family protein [Burkholderiaceae bacterium]
MGGVAAYSGWIARKTAPNVGYTLLDGSSSSLQSLRGKVVLVNFWTTDCEPCVREMPQFVATHEKFKARGFETLAVSMSYNAPALVVNFAERRHLPFGVVIDNTGAVAQGFGDVAFTPTSVLIDKHGRIVQRVVGATDFAALDKLVEKLLAET